MSKKYFQNGVQMEGTPEAIYKMLVEQFIEGNITEAQYHAGINNLNEIKKDLQKSK